MVQMFNTWCESCPWHQLAWQIFIGFSTSFQPNVAVVLQTGCDHFLPRPFQLIMHQPVFVWWWLLIMIQVSGYSLLILCTMHCYIGKPVSGRFWLQAVHHSSGDRCLCHVQIKNVYSAGCWSCAVGTYSFHIKSKVDWDCLQFFVTKADQNMVQLNLLLKYVAADNEAANLLPKWVWHVICRMVRQAVRHWRDRKHEGILDRCVCVCVWSSLPWIHAK